MTHPTEQRSAEEAEIDRVAEIIRDRASQCDSGTFRMPVDVARYIASYIVERYSTASRAGKVDARKVAEEIFSTFWVADSPDSLRRDYVDRVAAIISRSLGGEG